MECCISAEMLTSHLEECLSLYRSPKQLEALPAERGERKLKAAVAKRKEVNRLSDLTRIEVEV